MIMAAALVVAGLFYVAIVMILIIVHHFMYDRDPRAVPPYVRRALQFDSDTDSEVDESGGRNKKETKIVEIEVEESGNYEDTSDFSSHKARKMGNMDKFLGKDIDVSR
ncbi:uncharacterized protein LOC110853621 isoform X2 [Folsomia candida]|uniref:uncharacterized protein LOC110853621 isoform X2 n=1 Tax=Folsomia candida TaxID=158441 RepID=UPI001604C2D7|nr:uncharacterized protein LOC110853621 isoform X2 [Folsomia candida]